MEQFQWLNIALLFSLLTVLKLFLKRPGSSKNLPPGPPALPIIGHLHLLKNPLPITFHEMRKKYGSVLLLRFGMKKVLVVSSSSAAEECFTQNDIIFANRPRTLAGNHLNYNYRTVGFCNYGDRWRSLRRLMTVELLSTSRLAMLAVIRQDEVKLLVKQLFEISSQELIKVELTSKLKALTFNMMLRMIAGKRYYGNDALDEGAKQFQEIMGEYFELVTKSNLSDLLPFLRWLDIQGMEKRMKKLMKKLDNFLQLLIDEHRQTRSDSGAREAEGKMTLIDLMLSLHETEPELYTDGTIKGVILVVLTAGSDTSSTTMEWALSLLLNYPEAMQRALAEIQAKLGQDHLCSEADLQKLSYLQNVINETFRLYPTAPLLFPHESSDACTVSGFDIPPGTMLLVNIWSIQRDPKIWKEPTRFMPERFENEEGEGYNLMPFGAGRRICPGAALGRRMIGMVLGTLIQCFEWERVSTEKINIPVASVNLNPGAEPLQVLCKPRCAMMNLLNNL